MALGMVMQLPDQDDETSVSRRQLLAKLDVCMGGRVAEELIFGESNITTGVTQNLHPCGVLVAGSCINICLHIMICWAVCISRFDGQSVEYAGQVCIGAPPKLSIVAALTGLGMGIWMGAVNSSCTLTKTCYRRLSLSSIADHLSLAWLLY